MVGFSFHSVSPCVNFLDSASAITLFTPGICEAVKKLLFLIAHNQICLVKEFKFSLELPFLFMQATAVVLSEKT